MIESIEALTVSLRREMEAENYAEAAAIAAKLDRLQGEPIEDDRIPEIIPTWGIDD